jgi:hypothetical protein
MQVSLSAPPPGLARLFCALHENMLHIVQHQDNTLLLKGKITLQACFTLVEHNRKAAFQCEFR